MGKSGRLVQKVVCKKCQRVHELEREVLDTHTFKVLCHNCEAIITAHYEPEQITHFLEEKRRKNNG